MSFSQFPDSPAAVFAIVLEVALKGTLLLVLAGMTAFIFRRAAASMRHLLWSFALVAMLAIPVLTLVLPRWNLSIVPAPARELVADRTRGSLGSGDRLERLDDPSAMDGRLVNLSPSDGASSSVSAVGPRTTNAPSAALPEAASLAGSLALLWIGGLCAGLIMIAGGALALRRLAVSARELDTVDWAKLRDEITRDLGITRPVRLLLGDSAAMPATWGFLRPVVLLPSDATAWTDERRRVVLLHELAHVSRNDFLMQLVAQVCCAVYWFHPAVWYTARQLRAERELACDEHVLDVGVNACDYAAHLLEIARVFRAPVGSGIVAVAMARPSQLEGRVLAILDGSSGSRGRASRKARVVAISGLALISLPLAAMQPWAANITANQAVTVNPSASAISSTGRGQGTGTGTGIGTGVGVGVGVGESDPLVWKGRVPAGKWVEIISVYGDIRAELARGSEVEVFAVQKNGVAKAVKIDMRQTRDGGVTFCAIDARIPQSGKACSTDERGRLIAGLPDTRVDFLVKVPAGVGIAAHTGRGNVAAEKLQSYVWGTANKGDISISTTDLAEASTGTGSISAQFGRRSWKQNLEFLAETGNVTVIAPSDAGMVVEARTSNGTVRSDFPGEIRPFKSGQHSFAKVGGGGGPLTLFTENGYVELKRGRPASGSTSSMETSRVDPKPNPNPDPAYDPNPNEDPRDNPDPNLNPDIETNIETKTETNIETDDENPTGERVVFSIPDGMLSRLSPDRMRTAPDAKAIERLRAIAVTHVKQHSADLVKERSLWALTLVRDGRIVEPLRAAMSNADWKVRAYAAWALSEANDPRGQDRLIAALGDSHWRVRMHAAGGLQRLGGPRAIDPLINVLTDDYWQVRISAVDALARIGDRRAIPSLTAVANNDAREMVREEARSALQRIR